METHSSYSIVYTRVDIDAKRSTDVRTDNAFSAYITFIIRTLFLINSI